MSGNERPQPDPADYAKAAALALALFEGDVSAANRIVPDPAARALAFALADQVLGSLVESYGERNAKSVLSAIITRFVEQSLDD